MRGHKSGPNPYLDALLESARAPDGDEDVGLVNANAPDDEDPPSVLKTLNRFSRGEGAKGKFYVVPCWVLGELVRVRAYHAIPLVLAVMQRAKMRREKTVPITSAIWTKAGSPSADERQTILEHLRRVPGVLRLEPRHKGYTRYQATLGDMWK